MTAREQLDQLLEAELIKMREEVEFLRKELKLAWRAEDKRRASIVMARERAERWQKFYERHKDILPHHR